MYIQVGGVSCYGCSTLPFLDSERFPQGPRVSQGFAPEECSETLQELSHKMLVQFARCPEGW